MTAVIFAIPVVFPFQLAFAQTCDQFLMENHHARFRVIRNGIEEATTVKTLEAYKRWMIKDGLKRRDFGIECMQEGADADKERFWDISYVYRVLSDTLVSLDSPTGGWRLEALKQKILERMEFASENL